MKNDAAITTKLNIPEIYARKEGFQNLCKQIDDLERFVNIVNNNLTTLEANVSEAEEKLGVNELGIKGLLKPIFSSMSKKKITTDIDTLAAEQRANPYEPPEIFRTSDYFGIRSDET